MNVLMLGSGKGSWVVRGQQLGGAIGARVVHAPSDDDMRWADVVVMVKRALMSWADIARRFGKPIVWDALDFWQQPTQNGFTQGQAIGLLDETIYRYKPTLVIGATEAMAKAAGGVYLPHHSRPDLTPAPAREVVTTVGYEGKRKYLGRWGQLVAVECQRRGWRFVINPHDLRECDILVAFRDGEWDGWMCREWKSGVKLVNASAAGRPIIGQQSAAMDEIQCVRSTVDNMWGDLNQALDGWSEFDVRRDAHERTLSLALAQPYTLPTVADNYRQILQGVAEAKAA